MLRTCLTLLLLVTVTPFIAAQAQPSPPPQTARQALIEMFTGKSPDAFEKHLPEVARHALIHKGDSRSTSWVQQFAALSHELSSQGRVLETFDAGPLLLSVEDHGATDNLEIIVERDNLIGEEDEIELSFQLFQEGEAKPLPVLPRFIFTMKQEKDIWRVSEAELVVHAPLADPEYLKTLTKMQNVENEAAAQRRISELVQMETTYAASNPERGYTCKLSDLNTKDDQDDADQPPAAPSKPADAGDENGGFRFVISGCNGIPATKFHITAVPLDSDSGMKAFCADKSSKIRFANDGTAASCLSAGEFVPLDGGARN
jgi:hypothetical protein